MRHAWNRPHVGTAFSPIQPIGYTTPSTLNVSMLIKVKTDWRYGDAATRTMRKAHINTSGEAR